MSAIIYLSKNIHHHLSNLSIYSVRNVIVLLYNCIYVKYVHLRLQTLDIHVMSKYRQHVMGVT